MSEGMDLGPAIRRAITELEARNPVLSDTALIRQAWCKCAGPELLEHTDYVFVVPDSNCSEVVIYVDSQIWATELGLRAELLRLKLNIEVARMLQRAGRAPEHDEGALFDVESAEQVKRLRFSPSNEKYTRFYAQDAKEEELEGKRRGEAAELSAAELAELDEQVQQIEDPNLREVAYKAAKAHLELLKGERESQE